MKTKLAVDLIHNGQEFKAGMEIDLPPDLAAIFGVKAGRVAPSAPQPPSPPKASATPKTN